MSTEKEFVPYEEALALKELGFNEPCFGCFNHLDKSEIWTNRTYMNGLTENITAPTFSQAFRWFREKYNLDCSVMLHVVRYGITKGIYFEKRSYKYQIRRSFKNPFWIEFDSFKTYEEAELACLRKLIETKKEK